MGSNSSRERGLSSTREIDRDVMQVAGALSVGDQNTVEIVDRLREGDADVKEILDRVREEDLDVEKTLAAQRLERASQPTFSALVALQQQKPFLLQALAGLSGRSTWQELLKTA